MFSDSAKKNIDIFIDMILENKIDPQEFIYLIKKEKGDPYDLEEAEYTYIQRHKI